MIYRSEIQLYGRPVKGKLFNSKDLQSILVGRDGIFFIFFFLSIEARIIASTDIHLIFCPFYRKSFLCKYLKRLLECF